MSNSSVKLKTIALASVVGVPPSAISDICAKQPLLLNLSAKSLVAKTRALKEVLGYSDLQLWQVVFTKPGVLLFASDKLRAKWESLQQLAGEAAAGTTAAAAAAVLLQVAGFFFDLGGPGVGGQRVPPERRGLLRSCNHAGVVGGPCSV